MGKKRRMSVVSRKLIVERLSARIALAADANPFARELGIIEREPQELINHDRQMYSSGGQPGSGPGLGLAPFADTFFMNSRPNATKTVFLDFDGNITQGTFWNTANNVQTITSPAYDPEGNGPTFTNNELLRIQRAWHRVAQDFAPFDVNVTTQDPGVNNLVNTGGSDTRWGIRVVITVDNFASSGAGGFAYINSFNWGFQTSGATDTPAFVFNASEIGVSAAVTHEAGHALGLSHDGTTASNPIQPNAVYYNGHGSGETDWGPIMGSGYYSNVTTWDRGEYFGANNGDESSANYGRGPDDLFVITNFNGFGYRPDDHGNSIPSASTVDYLGTDPNTGLTAISMLGVIENRTDLDFIEIETGGGSFNLTIDPYVSVFWVPNGDGTYSRSSESTF